MIKEFLEFLKEYKVIALGIAFVMGTAGTNLVNSLVRDVLMPIIAPLLSTQTWDKAMLNIGPVSIAYGSFLAALLNFIILAFLVFIIAKKLLEPTNWQRAAGFAKQKKEAILRHAKPIISRKSQ